MTPLSVPIPRRWRLPSGAACLLWLLIAAPSCKKAPAPAAADKVMVEVRGPEGGLRLQLAHEGENFGDERLVWYAGPEAGGTLQRLTAQAGTTSVEGPRVGVRRTQDGALVLTRNGSVLLNIDRRGGILRLGNAEGFPAGRIHRDAKVARLHGPGGELRAQAQVEGERVSVSDREGKALGYVLGAAGPEEALLPFLPGLAPVEQALLLATELPGTSSPGR